MKTILLDRVTTLDFIWQCSLFSNQFLFWIIICVWLIIKLLCKYVESMSGVLSLYTCWFILFDIRNIWTIKSNYIPTQYIITNVLINCKQGTCPKKFPARENRTFGNVAKTQGILPKHKKFSVLKSILKFPYSKDQGYCASCCKFLQFFKRTELPSQICISSILKSLKFAQGEFAVG